MREFLGIDTMANLVCMLRSESPAAILLADDDWTGAFLETIIHSAARVVPAPSLAVSLLDVTQQRGAAGVVAVLTRRSKAATAPDVFLFSHGDAPSLLLASSTFRQTIAALAGENWVRAAEQLVGDLRERAVWLAWLYGEVLKTQDLAVSALALDILDFVDWTTFTPNLSQIERVFGKQGRQFVEVHSFQNAPSFTEMLVACEGMIACQILVDGLSKFRPHGLTPKSTIDLAFLLTSLRVGFQPVEFELDDAYWDMRAWERSHPAYALLKKWRLLDPLNVLLDQRYWTEDLRRVALHPRKHGGFSVLKLDLDNFKEVNTALGHEGGDEAIRLAADVLMGASTRIADAYRRGGDEMVAIAPGVTGEAAKNWAEEVREKVESAFRDWGSGKGLTKFPTASIGLVEVLSITDTSVIVETLDDAQGIAKKSGKNRVVVRQCGASK